MRCAASDPIRYQADSVVRLGRNYIRYAISLVRSTEFPYPLIAGRGPTSPFKNGRLSQNFESTAIQHRTAITIRWPSNRNGNLMDRA